MTIELGKQYRTRDGRDVRIYAVDGGGEWPVHGAIKSGDEWDCRLWCANGIYHDGKLGSADLIEVKPKITRTFWCVWIGDASKPAEVETSEGIARLQAKHCAETYGKPCSVTRHEITFAEGEGLS